MVAIRKHSRHQKRGMCSVSTLMIVIGVAICLHLAIRMNSSSSGSSSPVATGGLENQLRESRQRLGNPGRPKQPPIQVHKVVPKSDDGKSQDPPMKEPNGKNSEGADDDKVESPDEHQGGGGSNHEDPDEHQVPNMPDPNEEPEDRLGEHQLGEPIKGSLKDQQAVDRIGSGPTNVGYLKDFDYERGHPLFRTADVPKAEDTAKKVASLVGETESITLLPCSRQTKTGTVTEPSCLAESTSHVAFNSAPFPRSLCGHHIEGNHAIKLDEPCQDPIVRLLPVDEPPVNGEDMEPIIIKSHEEELADSDLDDVQCDIPCKIEKGIDGSNRYIDGEPWKITYTMEDAYRSMQAKIERVDFRRNHYYATQSWLSSVPLTHFTFDKYSLENRPAVDWGAAEAKGIYIVNTLCSSQGSKRQKYFGAVSKVFPVDSYGVCHHNKDVPSGETIETPEGRINLMKKYRIVLAFDASTTKDHISEGIWEAWLSGSVPVFVGAENARLHFPPNSAIYSGDFSNWDDMAEHVNKVANNRTLWESYQKWRSDPVALQQFRSRYEFTKTSPDCRMCRWAYAKRFGLGWDHARQEVRPPFLSRDFCVNSAHGGLLASPFKEVWVVKKDANNLMSIAPDENVDSTCSESSTDGVVELGSPHVHRIITRHDNVIDISISSIEMGDNDDDGEVLLALHVPKMLNADGASFSNTHTLIPTAHGSLFSSITVQDEHSKLTVLANWETQMDSPEEGQIHVTISNGKLPPHGATKRLRIVMCDTSELHDKMTEYYPSTFEFKVMKDFIDPLEIFATES